MVAESSVVVALAEVRRLERERRQREADEKVARITQARMEEQQHAEQRHSYSRPAVNSGFDPEMTPPPRPGHTGAYGSALRRTAEFGPFDMQPRTTDGYQRQTGSAFQAQTPFAGMMPEHKPRSVATPVFLTLLLCAGAAAAGYWKLEVLRQETATRHAATVSRVEQERTDESAARSRTDQSAKLRIAALETKVKELEGRLQVRTSDPEGPGPEVVAAAPAAPVRTIKPTTSPARTVKAKAATSKKAVAAKTAQEKPEPVIMPKIAKKKALSDDPLSGLKM